MNVSLKQFGIDQLSVDERCQLIELLWDSLPEDQPFVPPEWHLKELDKRIAEADSNPGAGEPWEDILARLSRKP